MKCAIYDTLVEAISDYLGKGIELGKNASYFSHNGCLFFDFGAKMKNSFGL